MKTILRVLFISALCACVVACKHDPELNVSPDRSSLSFSSEGGNEMIVVTSEHTSWSVRISYTSTGPDWLEYKIDKNTVTLTAEKNQTIKERTAIVFIDCKADSELSRSIEVTQEGVDIMLEVEQDTYDIPTDGMSKTLKITCNTDWSFSDIPSWISLNPTQGSGSKSVTMTVRQNTNKSGRSASLLLSTDGNTEGKEEKSLNINVSQKGSGPENCWARPANILRLCYDVAMNFECGSNVKFFYVRAFQTSTMSIRTEDEIVNSVRGEGELWERTSRSDASLATCFGNQLSPNTSYTIITVSYSSDDKLGDIEQIEIKTKPLINQPMVDLNDIGIGSKGGNQVYGIEAQKGQNGYCNKYYVWGAAGQLISSAFLYEAINCWYIWQEIKRNPNSHQTTLNMTLDKITGYTTKGREYLHGPLSQEISTSSDLSFSQDDEMVEVILWGMDIDGEFSGLVYDNVWTFGGSQSTQAKAPKLSLARPKVPYGLSLQLKRISKEAARVLNKQ